MIPKTTENTTILSLNGIFERFLNWNRFLLETESSASFCSLATRSIAVVLVSALGTLCASGAIRDALGTAWWSLRGLLYTAYVLRIGDKGTSFLLFSPTRCLFANIYSY